MKQTKAIKSINPKREPLTTENVRTFPGFENISDEEAENIVYSIHALCRIVYEYITEQNNSGNTNQLNNAA